MPIVRKTVAETDEHPKRAAELRRKDLRNGMRVVVVSQNDGVIMRATVRSSPFNESWKNPNKENGQKILLRNEGDHPLRDGVVKVLRATLTDEKGGRTYSCSLFNLGVEPNENGHPNSALRLLNADRYDNQQLREDGSDPLDPPER
jgi:hypothetical protein